MNVLQGILLIRMIIHEGNMKLQLTAKFLRSVSGSTDLEKTMNKVVATLGNGGIPSLIAGGMAVQESGYARFTVDVDVIVPNVAEAREYLSIRGFRPNPRGGSASWRRFSRPRSSFAPHPNRSGP